jgi:hypothetical protein
MDADLFAPIVLIIAVGLSWFAGYDAGKQTRL